MRYQRAHFITRALIFVGAALVLFPAASCRRKAPPAGPGATGGDGSAAQEAPLPGKIPASAELEALRAREKELTALLADLEAKGPPAAKTVRETLMGHLGSFDGRGMYETMRELLLKGEEGYRELLGFFIACDEKHDKILILTHDSRLVYAMLRLVALYPGKTAELCDYLIRNTRDIPGSFVRREIYNFLPVFLNYHRGKHPELRQLLKEDIVFQLKKGGQYLYKVTLAMRDLQFKPPIESMLPILYNLEDPTSHGIVIAHLAGRGDAGLQALIRFVEDTGDGAHRSVGQVLRHIVDLDALGRKGLALPFLEHANPGIRQTATFYYFRHPREPADLERALGYLDSGLTVAQQSLVLGSLKRKSPAIYRALLEDPARVTDEKVRARLEKAALKLKKEAGDDS